MLGSLRRAWPRVAAVLAGVVGLAGVTAWTATPVPATGLVVDVAGRPVANAVVRAPAALVTPAGQAVTDAGGRYQLGARRWPYDPLSLTVRAPGFLPARTTGGRLVLHRWPRLTGQVVDDAETAVPGTVVTFSLAGTVIDAVMTDMDGRFDVVLAAPAGTLTVTGLGDEHDVVSQPVSVAQDEAAAIRLTLPRQFARLHVESDPSDQQPRVDGAPPADCPATPCDARVTAGVHRVTFSDDLFVPWEQDVQIDKDATGSVRAKLERKTGTLAVSGPAGELTLDGQPLSGEPWSGTVPAGRHAIGLRSGATWPFLQSVDVAWNQTTQAALTPTPVVRDAAAFTAGLRAYLTAQGGGSYGVYLEELGSGSATGVGDTTLLEAASVIKVPEALYLLHQADAGELSLDDQIDLAAEDFMGGTGSLSGSAHAGDKYSYRSLLALLIQQSDNTAWQALRRTLGDASINAYSSSLGAGDCNQVTDNCTARSAGHLLAELARGKLLSAGSTRLLLDLLETTIYNDRINWYLSGTTVAHKVGMDGGVRNDCGVVFLPNDPFAICVFTTVSDVDQGVQVIRDIARAAAWRYSH